MTKALPDITGQRFGLLVAIRELPRKNKMRNWLFQCDCGAEIESLQKNVCSGGIRRSCGCAVRKTNKHGLSKSPEYRAWMNMRSRCNNPNTPGFEHYGGRGICVCERWMMSFDNFLADMGPRPADNLSVDRIDVNGNYEPGNCRWANGQTQCRNTTVNHIVEIDGKSMTLAEAVDLTGAKYNTILYRIKRGWPVERALKESIHAKG